MPLVMDTRPAAYAVVIEDGKILLSRWVAPAESGLTGGWTLPGGGMDPGEQPADTAVREVFEETGYRVELDALLGVHTAYYDNGPHRPLPLCAFRTVYTGHVVGGELTHEIGGSTDMAAWIPLEELADLPHVALVDEAARMLGYANAADLGNTYGKDTDHA